MNAPGHDEAGPSDASIRLRIITLYDPPLLMETPKNSSVKQFRKDLVQFLAQKAVQAKEGNICLRIKPSMADPGQELLDVDPAGNFATHLNSSYGVKEGTAIFLKFVKSPEPESAPATVPANTPAPAPPATRSPHPRGPGTRKENEKWNEDHIKALVEGVEHFGLGSWAKIFQDKYHQLPSQANQVTLKDKWRNISKTVCSGKKLRGVTLDSDMIERIKRLHNWR